MKELDQKRFKQMADSIAQRPQMYVGSLGSNGLYDLIYEVLSFIIFEYHKTVPLFVIEYEGGKTYCISVKNVPFIAEVFQGLFDFEKFSIPGSHLLMLLAMSSDSRFSIRNNETVHEWRFNGGEFAGYGNLIALSEIAFELRFSFDEAYFKEDIEYYELNKMCVDLAMLNKNASFLLKGKTHPFLSQNFICFPCGLSHKLDRLCDGKQRFSALVSIDEYFNGNYYQVGVAFQNDTYWDIGKITYAGYRQTKEGGSLLDGIVAGIVDVRKNYRRTHVCKNDYADSIRRFKARLVIVAQVLTEDGTYGYCGATKRKLEMPQIKKDVRRLVRDKVNAVFEDNPELEYIVCNA